MEFNGFEQDFCSMPKSLLNIDPLELVNAIYKYPQGSGTTHTVLYNLNHGSEIEIVNQNHDYAVLRMSPSPLLNRGVPAHWLTGFSDRDLFLHAMPYGDIDYSSEPWWYILNYLNRKDQGYERLQGDLLFRKFDDWEHENMVNLLKEDPYLIQDHTYTVLGNSHNVCGSSSQPKNDDSGGQKITTRTRERECVNVNHNEHPPANWESDKEEFQEVGMQRRDKRMPNGGKD